jgi:hypothetical protein
MQSPDKMKTNEPDFLPLFSNDDKNNVIGTQLVFHMENKEYGTRIVNLENFGKDDYQYENKFTTFGYKVYNREIKGVNKFLLVEAKLKD